MAKLLSKRIGNTRISGDIVPQYVQNSSIALNKVLISLGPDSLKKTNPSFNSPAKVNDKIQAMNCSKVSVHGNGKPSISKNFAAAANDDVKKP